MRVVTKILSIGAVFVAGSLALASVAQAQDHWDRDHYDHRYDRYHHDHYVEQRPVYVAPRPPVYVVPPVVVAPPAMVGPPSLNLNMNIPL